MFANIHVTINKTSHEALKTTVCSILGTDDILPIREIVWAGDNLPLLKVIRL